MSRRLDWTRSRQLDDLLEGRPDWSLEEDGRGGWIWRCEKDGATRIVIAVAADGFHIYDRDNDVKVDVKAIEAVEAWLELDETDHSSLSEIGKQLAGGLLVFKTEKWLEEGRTEEGRTEENRTEERPDQI